MTSPFALTCEELLQRTVADGPLLTAIFGERKQTQHPMRRMDEQQHEKDSLRGNTTQSD